MQNGVETLTKSLLISDSSHRTKRIEQCTLNRSIVQGWVQLGQGGTVTRGGGVQSWNGECTTLGVLKINKKAMKSIRKR